MKEKREKRQDRLIRLHLIGMKIKEKNILKLISKFSFLHLSECTKKHRHLQNIYSSRVTKRRESFRSKMFRSKKQKRADIDRERVRERERVIKCVCVFAPLFQHA
jgi:hypothetical protein